MQKSNVDLTAEDVQHLDAIMQYYATGRFGIEISREDAIRAAVRELAARVKPGQIVNDAGSPTQSGARCKVERETGCSGSDVVVVRRVVAREQREVVLRAGSPFNPDLGTARR